jgi:hypothetical protein
VSHLAAFGNPFTRFVEPGKLLAISVTVLSGFGH